ncbi:hypothetical protein CA830_07080 [Burkholderia multivorans]|nr:hypothetical protein CA830_07080 [Burkholderia multivorans]
MRGRRVRIRAQAVQRAVEMNVCRVDELHEIPLLDGARGGCRRIACDRRRAASCCRLPTAGDGT